MLHTLTSIFKHFEKRTKDVKTQPLEECYRKLMLVFVFNQLEKHAAPLIASGSLSQAHFGLMTNLKNSFYEWLSPHSLKLAEAIPYSDKLLFSALASTNEKPYENLYEWARKYAQLNQRENNPHPAIIKYWIPFSKRMKREYLTPQDRENQAKL